MSRATSTTTMKNLAVEELVQLAVATREGILSRSGALVTQTGSRTGRSPKDRFIVQDSSTLDTIHWGDVNQPIESAIFAKLWSKAEQHLENKTLYINELQVGADERYAIPVRVMTELAWHSAFCKHMFVGPVVDTVGAKPQWTLLNAASLRLEGAADGVYSDGVVIINLSERKVLLCGMLYAGEMKKAMFSVLNYFLPEAGVLPMHCAANCGLEGDVALFFGLSGTGKTTLSADPERLLIGDDEHGWSDDGVFNFEGGCYAKCIDLSREQEPVIWDAIRDNAIMENVVLNGNLEPDYTNDSLTQNSRSAYPRSHIPLRVEKNRAGLPQAVIFLTCDLYGVLPPVARLTKEQAAYYFLSGYTALVGSTEVGSTAGVKPTFSTCFGAPFFPRPAKVYADLLVTHIEKNDVPVYLINTGWHGGSYGNGGQRFSIPVTRKVVAAAISGELLDCEHQQYPGFGFNIPLALTGCDSHLLDPRENWSDAAAWKSTVNVLIDQFRANFEKYNEVPSAIAMAGPLPIE